ncbi:MAG: SRPBCC family protein [Ignavibacteriales bacterium]|nr:SRPBCC family protein [Ignavibacteriales bacterium]
MATLHHEITINAPLQKAWEVLADLEAVQHYNPMVARAKYISPNKTGIGAARHCDFKPNGWGKERVIGFEPQKFLAIELYESSWPMKFMRWRTSLKPVGKHTVVEQDLEYQLKFGILGKLLNALVMRKKLDTGIAEVFVGLKNFVESGAK